jgi:hypothetical protein
MLAELKILTHFIAKYLIFKSEDNVPAGKLYEENKYFFCILTVTEEKSLIRNGIRIR